MSDLNIPDFAYVVEDLEGRVTAVHSEAGMEAFSLSAVPSMFKDLAQSVLSSLKASVELADVDKIEPILSKDQVAFLKLVKVTPHISIGGMQGWCPEGLIKSYLDYLHVLEPACAHARTTLSNSVIPYEEFLARFMSDRLFSQDANTDKKRLDAMEKIRVTDAANLSKCFKKGSHETRVPVKTLVARANDWEPIFKSMGKCVEHVESVSVDELRSRVRSCSDMIETILKDFSKPGTDRKVSQEAAIRLGRHAGVVARDVEHYSALHYRVLTLKNTIEQTMKQISAIMGD